MSKESFKSFARSHPELANFVMNGKSTWQKFYELYDIYGENSNVWSKYFLKENIEEKTVEKVSSLTQDIPTSFKDLFNTIKNVDMESVQKGVTNLQKTIGLLQDIGVGNKQTNIKAPYEPRPLYRKFED